jgi:hypothetical protein
MGNNTKSKKPNAQQDLIQAILGNGTCQVGGYLKDDADGPATQVVITEDMRRILTLIAEAK